MAIQTQEQKQYKSRPYRRLAFALITFLFLLAAGVIWILNIQGIIKGPWSSILAVVFIILGVAFTLFQWLLPFSPESFKSSVTSYIQHSEKPPILNEENPTSMPHLTQADAIDRVNIRTQMQSIASALGVDENKGALVVYAAKRLLIDLYTTSQVPPSISLQTVEKHIVNGHPLWGAFFRSLKPGDYVAYDQDHNHLERVTISAGKITEVDWSSI